MPKLVGKYEIGKTLGEGSFGKVKYAVNVETNEAVAIKVSAPRREVWGGSGELARDRSDRSEERRVVGLTAATSAGNGTRTPLL
jgi:hypothetical protein